MEIKNQAMYIKSDVNANNNKFWEIKLYDTSVHLRWGRVGSDGQTKVKDFSSENQAEAFYNKKVKEKESNRKGYTKAKVLLDNNEEIKVSTGDNLADVAIEQINSSSSETAKLIKMLAKRNIHNIVSSTSIKYDASKGSFRTPLGIITKEGITEARKVLNELIPYVEKEQYSDDTFIKKLQDYLQLIPHDIGRKFVPKNIFPDMDQFQKEGQILDALDASLQEVLTTTQPKTKKDQKEQPKLFDVKVDVLNKGKEWKRIRDFYHSKAKRMHTSHGLDVKKVYIVKIKSMHDAFMKKGKTIGNIMELWHGSRIENCLSILKSGLIIPSSSSGHVTGRMFGNGVYASDISTKALNYAQGYWGHGSMESNCFMFLVDFAMGKTYIPRSYSESLPKAGYDSTFAKEHQSGIMNNEMIVYNLYQCNIKYLVEFDD